MISGYYSEKQYRNLIGLELHKMSNNYYDYYANYVECLFKFFIFDKKEGKQLVGSGQSHLCHDLCLIINISMKNKQKQKK